MRWAGLATFLMGLVAPSTSLAQVPLPQSVGRPGIEMTGGNQRFQLMMGEKYLNDQQPRLAMKTFQEILEARPNHLRAKVGLLDAMAQLGYCDEAEMLFEELRGTPKDNRRSRVALGECAEILGQLDLAVSLYRDAADSDPYDAEARYALADLLSRMGSPEAEEVRLDLFGTERGLGYAFLAEARERRRRGDPVAYAALEATTPFRFVKDVRMGIVVEEALLSLDVCQYFSSRGAISFVNMEVSAARAECERRAGEPEEALEDLVPRNLIHQEDSAPFAAVRVRLLVDLGRLEEASAIARGLPDELAPTLASRWYLAQAKGDEQAAAYWASRYDEHPDSGNEPLTALVVPSL